VDAASIFMAAAKSKKIISNPEKNVMSCAYITKGRIYTHSDPENIVMTSQQFGDLARGKFVCGPIGKGRDANRLYLVGVKQGLERIISGLKWNVKIFVCRAKKDDKMFLPDSC